MRNSGYRLSPRRVNTSSKEPEWLRRRELYFLRTGKLNLSGLSIPDLSAVKSRVTLKEINISRTQLTSLAGLPVQPNIACLNAEKSRLSSFVDFSSISSASIFHLKGTPLAEDPLHLLGIAIMSDAEKPIVDGCLVPVIWKKRAAKYPPFVRDLLNCGWKLEFPCPGGDQLREACRHYNVTYIEDDDIKVDTDTESGETLEGMNYDGMEFMEMITALTQKHEEIIEKAGQHFDGEDESEAKFQEKIIELLKNKRGVLFDYGKDLNQQILSVIRSLCVAADK
jgi:hypothetical protein